MATVLSTKLKPLSHVAIDGAAISYYSLHFQRDGGPLTVSVMILSKHAHMYYAYTQHNLDDIFSIS